MFDFLKMFFGEKKLSPQEQLQKTLNEGTEKLKLARIKLSEASNVIRSLKQKVAASEDDIRTINLIIKTSLQASNNEAARVNMDRLITEEDELKQKQEKLLSALNQFKKDEKYVQDFHQKLIKLQEEARDKELKIDISNFKIESNAVLIDLKDHSDTLSQKELETTSRAKADEVHDPNKDYEEAARKIQIEERLKQVFKND